LGDSSLAFCFPWEFRFLRAQLPFKSLPAPISVS
jgi:hypothetical protein